VALVADRKLVMHDIWKFCLGPARRVLLISLAICCLGSSSVSAQQLTQEELQALSEYPSWVSSSCDITNATSFDANGIVDKFLQALSYQENGGKVLGTSGTGAQGKFQYIDSTWQSSAKSYYPPAEQYTSANSAPEPVQDAVAYLEYTAKFKEFKGDLFKIAVSHFYPIANTNTSLLDVRPPGNIVTPRQYANSLIKHIKNDDGKNIELKYAQAPDFAKWLAKGGGPSGDAPSVSESDTSSASLGACGCSSEQTANAANGDTIVIDPGHGPNKTTVDAETGLKMVESNNTPEVQDVWDVAQLAKHLLESDGYKVVLTKKSVGDDVTFRDRAQTADSNNAALALSIHGDPGLGNNGEIYAQQVGLYRGSGSNRTVFSSESTATKSQQYADVFKQERQKIEGGSIVVKVNDSFSGRAGMEPGNIPMVQLFSKTPWVYNEAKMPFSKTDYAKGLVNSVEKIVKPKGGHTQQDAAEGDTASACAPSGSIAAAVQLAMQYSWADGPHGTKMKSNYAAAVAAARAKGDYVGGLALPGIDCGGFITTVMHNSGADPQYNEKKGGTEIQQAYMDHHPEKYRKLGAVSSTKDLLPGDIAINSGHTFMYVGPQSDHPNFKGDQASASLDTRAPSAETLGVYPGHSDGPFTFYRLIGSAAT
jgi:N-acetylmuramoyl-L-alanine amidase